VRVNVGGDPERDDYGLPPVDVVIPDDARELERDVQAYQRELRALRRRQRATRLRGPLTRDGMVLPLLAGCLILALITSTLLIMFAADQTGMPNLPGRTPAAPPVANPRPANPRRAPVAGQIGGPLPAAFIVINGRPVDVRAVTAAKPSVLALIPRPCPCVPALRQLRSQAATAHVTLYLVATGGDLKQVESMAAQAGQKPALVGDDADNVLGRTYKPLGLTAILVGRGGAVASVVPDLTLPRRPNLGSSLRQLGSAGR
jgi:hypothetical protein